MADITDPQAVRFANEKVRVLADLATRYYYAALAFANEWDANNIGAIIPSTPDVIVDGSATDGRTPITGANVNALHGHLAMMITDLEASANQKLDVLLKIEVNGSP